MFGDYYEGVMADFALNEGDFDFISTYDIVVSGFWGHCLKDFERLHTSGIKTAFDFATKIDDPSVKEACGHMDYSFFSYDGDDEKRLRSRMKELYAAGTKIVVATRGEKGSLAFDGTTFTEFGIIPCKVVDTIGAGDSYIAGFLFAQGEKKDIRASMECGARTSAETIGYAGAW
jgi:fructoselysine 6-kinase